MSSRAWLLHGLLALCVLAAGCIHRLHRTLAADIHGVDRDAPWLKAHMINGDVYVLDSWTVSETQPTTVIGTGRLLGVDRATVTEGTFRIPVSDVALFETNEVQTSPAVAALAVVSVVSVIVTAACLTDTKACFGSCPTFYAPGDDGAPTLQAEGFSDSIAPALEAHDVDALWRTHAAPGSTLTLRMTNEAYETHVVKQADLLAVARPRGGRVFSDGEAFWPATAVVAPRACRAAEGDCLAAVRAIDGVERTSTTDPHDLGATETIELAFDAPPGAPRLGVAIATRQTFVTTFLLYQGLAWLGPDAAAALAQVGQGAPGARATHLIGGIEVQLPDDGGAWRTVGEAYETGPIATDVHLVVLPEGAHGGRVRLRLPRGGWRVDAVMVAALGAPEAPVRIAPRAIRGTLSRDYGAGRAPATSFPIVTVPGDAYELDYDVPPGGDTGGWELFLDSRGYYLEWMRAEWMGERDPLHALRMLLDPDGVKRELAPKFKQLEPHMEEIFWRSRYARP